VVLFTEYYQGDQIRENVIGATCSTNVRMGLRETGWEGVDWIHLAQDRVQWRGLVDTVINLHVS
jgi:hypothetical protein